MMYKNKQVVCKDGFKMSVQANDSAYCSPRINNAERYTSVEIGFPSEKEELTKKTEHLELMHMLL